jgi:hypothetical protein
MTHVPTRRRARLAAPIRRSVGNWNPAAVALLRRFQDAYDRAADAADCSDESLARYDRMLAEEAELCAVPPDLLRAICWYASGWRQFEPSGRTLATPDASGTRWGCMQLSDHWHPDAFPSAMVDPRANIRYAANLLHWLNEQTGSWRRATVAFFGHDARAEHAGRRVQRYREQCPWNVRLAPITATRPASADTSRGDDEPATSAGDDAPLDDLYADLAL